ncbi:hypothetical protein K438DRAFT_2144247 [Mycena galopus ATCC 62051]|nr:hypothetical protein K438DRAFT_2144247 [Mycena galopus ATCC 62051]
MFWNPGDESQRHPEQMHGAPKTGNRQPKISGIRCHRIVVSIALPERRYSRQMVHSASNFSQGVCRMGQRGAAICLELGGLDCRQIPQPREGSRRWRKKEGKDLFEATDWAVIVLGEKESECITEKIRQGEKTVGARWMIGPQQVRDTSTYEARRGAKAERTDDAKIDCSAVNTESSGPAREDRDPAGPSCRSTTEWVRVATGFILQPAVSCRSSEIIICDAVITRRGRAGIVVAVKEQTEMRHESKRRGFDARSVRYPHRVPHHDATRQGRDPCDPPTVSPSATGSGLCEGKCNAGCDAQGPSELGGSTAGCSSSLSQHKTLHETKRDAALGVRGHAAGDIGRENYEMVGVHAQGYKTVSPAPQGAKISPRLASGQIREELGQNAISTQKIAYKGRGGAGFRCLAIALLDADLIQSHNGLVRRQSTDHRPENLKSTHYRRGARWIHFHRHFLIKNLLSPNLFMLHRFSISTLGNDSNSDLRLTVIKLHLAASCRIRNSTIIHPLMPPNSASVKLSGQSDPSAKPLRVITVGGGLGGLAAEIGAGIQVRRQRRLSSILLSLRSTIYIGPNMSRLLIKWGLGDNLRQAAVKPEAVTKAPTVSVCNRFLYTVNLGRTGKSTGLSWGKLEHSGILIEANLRNSSPSTSRERLSWKYALNHNVASTSSRHLQGRVYTVWKAALRVDGHSGH